MVMLTYFSFRVALLTRNNLSFTPPSFQPSKNTFSLGAVVVRLTNMIVDSSLVLQQVTQRMNGSYPSRWSALWPLWYGTVQWKGHTRLQIFRFMQHSKTGQMDAIWKRVTSEQRHMKMFTMAIPCSSVIWKQKSQFSSINWCRVSITKSGKFLLVSLDQFTDFLYI